MNAILVETIKREKEKLVGYWWAYALGFLLFGLIPYVNYYYLDGETHSRVIQFTEDINPDALRTNKDQYCPGEALLIETAFCKTRTVQSFGSSWYMANGTLIPVSVETQREDRIPTGCYPENGVTLIQVHYIPEDMTEGYHSSVGVTTHILSGDRLRHQNYRTIPYYVKSNEACNNIK